MTTEQSLLRAVLADPASDDSRLIYADYLDEQGEADRAEFIRVQVELAKKLAGIQTHHWYSLDMILDPQDADHQAWKQTIWRLQKREREMVKLFEWQGFRTAFGLPQHWPAWHLSAGPADWTAPPVPHWCGGVLRRGFVDEIRLPLAAFLEQVAGVFAAHPVTAVVLTDREPVQRATGRWSWEWDRDAAEPIGWNRVLYGLAMESDPYGVMAWPTPEDARRVLSGYLVNCGRKLAGLSPLG